MTGSRPKPRQGVYEEPFWQYVAQGELRLQQCVRCGHLRYPPAAACPACLSFETRWQALSGSGRVFAWTVFHRQYFPEIPVPYAVLSVQSDEGPLLIGNFVDGDIASLRHGLPVRVVFRDVPSPSGGWKIFQWTAA
jgi:uncharacterized OB-fold protein